MRKGSVWMMVRLLLLLLWQMRKLRILPTTTTGTRYCFQPTTITYFCCKWHFFNHVHDRHISLIYSSTVVGDRTPGGSTPSTTSITNIILLPQHDGEKVQHGDSEESIFSCPTLNRTLQLVVREISVQQQILICSFWFLVWKQLNLVAIVWNRTIFFYCGAPVDRLCLKA